jgi:glycosyltransferase involved in cell wall biosynthesis
VAVKVLFLHNSSDWIRGSENALLAALRGIDRNKITPFVLCGNPLLAAQAEDEGIETAILPMPDIMVDGGSARLQFGRWAKALYKSLTIVKRRSIELIYCNGGSTSQIGYYAAKLRGLPVICHLHSPYDRRYILLYRFHLASKVIFVSKAIERAIRGKQTFKAACEVVYNGVDSARFRPAGTRDWRWRERLSIPSDSVVFGQVSSLISRKGIDVLLRAFALLVRRAPQARLLLVGDGPQHADYIELAKHLGIVDKVVFAGYHSDPLPFYQHVFDANVLASRNDAFPLSLLEAAACGLPSIAASVDGIPEAIGDHQTGLLFDSQNHEMLAENMWLLISGPELRRRLGEAARQLAVTRFSMDAYCRSVERIILEQATVANRRKLATAPDAPVLSKHYEG